MSVQAIAVREEPDAEVLDGYTRQTISESVVPEDVLHWPGWRPLTMELPKDWQEGYLRAVGGKVEFVYGEPPAPPSRPSKR
jgi:hypothetical protein